MSLRPTPEAFAADYDGFSKLHRSCAPRQCGPIMPLATILVEDNKTIRDTLIPTMSDLADMEVIAIAETPFEAIQAMAQHRHRWQVAVVDLFLKEGTGLEVLQACRDRSPRQRVIVLSNYATPAMRQRCLELGADRIFDKSTEVEDFFSYCSSGLGL